ncbi:hypothetical protein GCM10010381_35500 [Streptomyces xantholiticus]|nr:hypothetical protein GCM10010381_35500 [Streptomyces xantholiticus]
MAWSSSKSTGVTLTPGCAFSAASAASRASTGAARSTARPSSFPVVVLAGADAAGSRAAADEVVARRGGDRLLPVEVTAAEGRQVAGSRSRPARVVGNLLDNAQRHTALR